MVRTKQPQKKIVKMEEILKESVPKNTEPDTIQGQQKKMSKETVTSVPRGKPKSGRIWKSEKKKFSSIIKTKGIRNSLEKKQALREKLKQIKELSNARKAARLEEKEQKKERRRANLKRQEENKLKSEVVQVITNTKKLKRMKKKHLRTIEKRDTTVVSK